MSFGGAMVQGLISPTALDKVRSVGLDVDSVTRLAGLPPAGRIAQCPEAWHLVTQDKWVLDIIKDGYKVQFLTLPKVPMSAANPPTDFAGKLELDQEVEDF